MPDPVTTFIGLSILSGVIGNRADAKVKTSWETFQKNLQQYRPYANHDVAREAYRAYLLATLQTCALLMERNGLKIHGWFRLGVFPENVATALRSLLPDAPESVFNAAHKQWLETVSKHHIDLLKELDNENFELPYEFEHEEFATLLSNIELLMQTQEAHKREQIIRTELLDRVLKDLEHQFNSVPEKFEALVREKWFEFLCANFQYSLKHQQEIANAFVSQLLAKLVERNELDQHFNYLVGETLKRIEAAQELILQEQRAGFADLNQGITSLIDSIDKTGLRHLKEPAPLIHTLPTQQEIEGRWNECETIMRTMASSKEHVVTFAAPGGFGKTALLAKVVQQLAPDGKTILEQITFPGSETFGTNTTALLHVDCRNDVKLKALFANAGRLIGHEQPFQEIYDSDAALSDKLQEIFSCLSKNGQRRTWFLFDNFEPLLNNQGEIVSEELSNFFGGIFTGEHNVYALVSGREVPRFSPQDRVFVLADVGGSLFGGLPLMDCMNYLRKNLSPKNLHGSREDVDSVLAAFANKVHRIPLALVWAIGYLSDTGYTLKAILNQQDLFADFDQKQAKEETRYKNRGLKRLHYEQLRIQSSDALSILRMLAFFKRSVPKGALAHLLNEIALNQALTRLEYNKLITGKESIDPYTRHLQNDLAINLYNLHPVICENDFFDSLPDKEKVYKAVAHDCWGLAIQAYEIKDFAYAHDLTDCAGKLYEHLWNKLGTLDVLRDYAAMLIAKGEILRNLPKLPESVAEFSKAIALLEPLANVEQQPSLAFDLSTAYLNNGAALYDLIQFQEAVAEFEKAVSILKSLFDAGSDRHKAKSLAVAYTNKGEALRASGKVSEAAEEHEKAIAILEPLVQLEKQTDLADTLGRAYLYKGLALFSADLQLKAAEVNDKGIKIFEYLIDVQEQSHLTNDLAEAYVTKARVLVAQKNWEAALASYQQAVTKYAFSVEQLGMYSVMPDLLEVLHYRLTILIELQRCKAAGQDVRKIISLYSLYLLNEAIEKSLKEAARTQFDQMVVTVRKLSATQRDSLYAEMGDEAERFRSLVEAGD